MQTNNFCPKKETSLGRRKCLTLKLIWMHLAGNILPLLQNINNMHKLMWFPLKLYDKNNGRKNFLSQKKFLPKQSNLTGTKVLTTLVSWAKGTNIHFFSSSRLLAYSLRNTKFVFITLKNFKYSWVCWTQQMMKYCHTSIEFLSKWWRTELLKCYFNNDKKLNVV